MNRETIYRQDVLDLAKKGVLISNGNYESVCKAINEIPPVNPIEPCKDAIDRAEAVRVASGYCHPANVAKELAKLPAVTPQPKTGHWIWCFGSHKCSNCEEYTCFSHKELLRYCPNCGAKMVEPQERSDKE